ncbi:universal stress protein [Listeria aquatica]|uniref:UspA domain-containing protein n=1 Tax=Listeria aquatica FSL S10-1188 TaxID=1265818 RepID=W7BFA4_9LIST|nr:universal stress protein [Listeria aquatica]EUJ21846.1 hypothetical protein MAQA_00550 [Listeria aquatica FSL S10-1188]
MTEKRKILVAVDGSEKSYHAFSEALEYGEKAEITLLAVVDQSLPNDQEFYLSPEYQILPETDEFETIAETYLNQLVASTDVKRPVKKVTAEGDASKQIVEYAEKHAIDLIILGRTGKNAVERMLLGSTSAYVTKHAPCSVLIVN